MIIVHLRAAIPEDRLLHIAAQWSGVPAEDIAHDYIPRDRGFLTTFELYGRGTNELDFARRLAVELKQDVVIAPPEERSPSHWWLVDPSGEVHDVMQALDDDDENLELVDTAA